MSDQEYYNNPLDEGNNQEDTVGQLIFDVFSNRLGEELILEFKSMISESRWNLGEELHNGLYREGGAQMLRYLINTYEQQKSIHNNKD